jgi:hypothetical protein
MRLNEAKPKFVENVPDVLDEGIIYISIPFRLAMHKCFCGCGGEVTTRIAPSGWEVSFNGEDVSFSPSIGPSTSKCKSHYVIRRGRVIWYPAMSDWQIDKVRERDARLRAGLPVPDYPVEEEPLEVKSVKPGLLQRLIAWIQHLRR